MSIIYDSVEFDFNKDETNPKLTQNKFFCLKSLGVKKSIAMEIVAIDEA